MTAPLQPTIVCRSDDVSGFISLSTVRRPRLPSEILNGERLNGEAQVADLDMKVLVATKLELESDDGVT